MFGGLFDGPKSKREAALQFCRNWIDIAGDEFETGLIAGHRVATAFPGRFQPTTVGSWQTKMKRRYGRGIDIGGNDPNRVITGTAAANLELSLALLWHRPDVSSTTELMYRLGMEPITIEQMQLFLDIQERNAEAVAWYHNDLGHIVVGDEGKSPEDYEPAEYAGQIHWPRKTLHYTALLNNAHDNPTTENRERDVRMRGSPDVNHSHGYCDVLHDYLVPIARDPVTRVVEIMPEPKDVSNLGRLIGEIREVWESVQGAFSDTHTPHPEYGGLLVPKDHLQQFQATFG
jgi:hypothetical protein